MTDTIDTKPHFSKYSLVIIIVLFAAFLFLYIQSFFYDSTTIALKGQNLDVLLAENMRQQVKGLGGRESLDEHDGMLFLYSGAHHVGIWMKDMEFPIDIVWLNDGIVVDIAKNVPVESGPDSDLTRYYPRSVADMVLELPAGWADTYELRIGDQLGAVEETLD